MKSLLDDLMQAPELKDFVLVGGTCLALRLGHRSSVDLDMFTSGSFDPEALAGWTQKKFPESKLIYSKTGGLAFFINGVKTEFVQWKEGFNLQGKEISGWRLLDIEGVTAMKCNAVLYRQEKKDYVDIAEILNKKSLTEVLGIFKKYYPYQQARPVLEKIMSFHKLDPSPDVKFLGNRSWDHSCQIIMDRTKQLKNETVEHKDKEKEVMKKV